jgi:fructokinase
VIQHFQGGSLDAIGVASFGPVELRMDHPEFGRIRLTPKPGWSGTDVVGPLADAFAVPTGFDTDVNGAALGEARWGSGQGLRSFVYVTVGTGIGGGGLIEAEPIHGLGHPEMGHMTVRRHPDDGFGGVCPFHGDCLEGLASGPAIAGRFGVPGARLTGEDFERALGIEAFYLAQMVRNLVYTMSPERVILGGGVSQMPGLVDAVADLVPSLLSGYPGLPEHEAGFVMPAGLGGDSGLAGGLVLAERALRSSG